MTGWDVTIEVKDNQDEVLDDCYYGISALEALRSGSKGLIITIFFKLNARFALFLFNTQLAVDCSLASKALLYFITKS